MFNVAGWPEPHAGCCGTDTPGGGPIHSPARLDAVSDVGSSTDDPAGHAVESEQSGRLDQLLACLPYEQREVVILHLHQEMSFREIARAMDVSINTVQSRYRYGLNKLRVILNGEVSE